MAQMMPHDWWYAPEAIEYSSVEVEPGYPDVAYVTGRLRSQEHDTYSMPIPTKEGCEP